VACGCGRAKSTPENPLIFGGAEGPVMRARTTVTIGGARAGEEVWVQGPNVEAMLAAGWLVAL